MTLNVDTLRKIAEQATPGPWEAKQTPIHTSSGEGGDYYVSCPTGIDVASTVGSSYEQEEPDALHIATFDPPTVLALLSRLEQAEQAVERAKAECARQKEQKGLLFRRATEAEQAVARVRSACESDSYDMHKDYGNGELVVPVDSIMNALEGVQA